MKKDTMIATIIFVGLAAVLFGGLAIVWGKLTSPSSDTTVTASTPSPTPSVDGIGQDTCDKYRLFADDVNKGLLITSEFRSRIQDIYNTGQYANPPISVDATELLKADTDLDVAGIKVAIKDFNADCTAIGH